MQEENVKIISIQHKKGTFVPQCPCYSRAGGALPPFPVLRRPCLEWVFKHCCNLLSSGVDVSCFRVTLCVPDGRSFLNACSIFPLIFEFCYHFSTLLDHSKYVIKGRIYSDLLSLSAKILRAFSLLKQTFVQFN